MEKETKSEFYTFAYTNQDDVTISLNFSVPPIGAPIYTFYDMCKRFARAVGYSEKTVEEWFGKSKERFGKSKERFTEYME